MTCNLSQLCFVKAYSVWVQKVKDQWYRVSISKFWHQLPPDE